MGTTQKSPRTFSQNYVVRSVSAFTIISQLENLSYG
nr:MAG TPA: hypothetical protein [Caudoviricetes sp.]